VHDEGIYSVDLFAVTQMWIRSLIV